MAREALGKGLDVILQRTTQQKQTAESSMVIDLPIDRIHPNERQPRTNFDPETLEELAASIREHGLVQPVVVRPMHDNMYELVAGERRWRAAGLAPVASLPAVVRNVSDEQMLIFALVENLQREDLNVIDQAEAMARLQSEFHFTHKEIGAMLGKARPTVSNILRIRELPREVRKMLQAEQLNLGHARVLLNLKKIDQARAAQSVVNLGLSVRATEAMVNKILGRNDGATAPIEIERERDPHVDALERELSEKFNAPVTIRVGKRFRSKGSISIRFTSLDELDGILAHLRR